MGSHPSQPGHPGMMGSHPSQPGHPGMMGSHPSQPGHPGMIGSHPSQPGHPGMMGSHPSQQGQPGHHYSLGVPLPAGLSGGSLNSADYAPHTLVPGHDRTKINEANHQKMVNTQMHQIQNEVAHGSMHNHMPHSYEHGGNANVYGAYGTGVAPVTSTTLYGSSDDITKRALCLTATLRNALYNFAELKTLNDIIKAYQYQITNDYQNIATPHFIKFYTEDAPKMLNFIQRNKTVSMRSSVKDFYEVIKTYLRTNKILLYETRMNGGKLNVVDSVCEIDMTSRLWPIVNKFGQTIGIPAQMTEDDDRTTNNFGTGLIASEIIELNKLPTIDKYQPSFTSPQFCELNDVEKTPLLQEYCSTSQYANISSLWQYRNFCDSTDVQKLNSVNAYCQNKNNRSRQNPFGNPADDYINTLPIQGYAERSTEDTIKKRAKKQKNIMHKNTQNDQMLQQQLDKQQKEIDILMEQQKTQQQIQIQENTLNQLKQQQAAYGTRIAQEIGYDTSVPPNPPHVQTQAYGSSAPKAPAPIPASAPKTPAPIPASAPKTQAPILASAPHGPAPAPHSPAPAPHGPAPAPHSPAPAPHGPAPAPHGSAPAPHGPAPAPHGPAPAPHGPAPAPHGPAPAPHGPAPAPHGPAPAPKAPTPPPAAKTPAPKAPTPPPTAKAPTPKAPTPPSHR